MVNNSFKRIALLSLGILMTAFVISCNSDDDAPAGEVTAVFNAQVDSENFLKYSFINVSTGATQFAWDFGDGNASVEVNPEHTYSEAGVYTVNLTATNGTNTDVATRIIEVVDPAAQANLLSGSDAAGKTWSLLREGTSMFLASGPDPTAEGYAIYWPGNANDGTRPCNYDDEITFTPSGDYIVDVAGTFWAEYGVFNGPLAGGSSCTPDEASVIGEACIDVTGGTLTNQCGNDVSDWLGGTFGYTYDASAGKITLNGSGAWIAIPKLGTTAEYAEPQPSVTFNATLVEGGSTGVDTMYVQFNYSGATWNATYVSYGSGVTPPEVVSIKSAFGVSANGLEVTFQNQSSGATSYAWDFGDGGTSTDENPVHTYAAEGTYTVTLEVSDGSSTASSSQVIEVSAVALDTPAPTPSQNAADVISVYSDAYTAITGVDLNPNWGQATVTAEVEVVAGDMVLQMSGLNYQGIDFSGNAQDVSGKTTIHLDVWTASSTTVNFSLISPGPLENAYALQLTGGQWNSFDIPLTEYSTPNLSEIFQFKFDDAGSGESPTIAVDNMYFY